MAKPTPELVFQQHIAHYLTAKHGYGVLTQQDIAHADDGLAEDRLWDFLNATQADSLQKLSADYGSDTRAEIFRALRKAVGHTPLWLLMRQGLRVRGIDLRLYYPKPRSAHSAAAAGYAHNRFDCLHHFRYGQPQQEIDFVLYLNGLPVVVVELKHEQGSQGWNVHDAVEQFTQRDHAHPIFRLPFLYLAADTSDVKAATDPRRADNFRWHNAGLTNTADTPGEYPVEHLYRDVLAPDRLLDLLAFFLVYVPARDAESDKPARPAFTILPRYHQSRMARKVADDALHHFSEHGDIGRKYLINHSAGSGKTLSICWLADRLHSLYKPDGAKLVDTVFILTDRKALDTNIRDDIEKFTHLKEVIGLARKADDLPRFLKERRPIVVTTQQKFAWVLDELTKTPELKSLRVAFLIDEAHRSQENQLGVAIRVPFRAGDEPDAGDPADAADEEENVAKIIREHDLNQLFVAFTATPSQATVQLFGEAFDTYSEAEAIAEGYIVDVATGIIAFETLYHLQCPVVPGADAEKAYPKGVIAKALQNVAYQDEGLLQYKAEVMLRIFEQDVKPLLGGRAKAMIVASSRLAGLRYFQILCEKLKERAADYGVLFAFSDFEHPDSHDTVRESAVNGLEEGELIEDRFEGDDFRLMVVANKFQTGFDQPLLAGMFLDKPVSDRNAVQTVSRLNRCYPGKEAGGVVVVDFTNNADAIFKAFTKYRQGTPYQPVEPDPENAGRLHGEILAKGVFSDADAAHWRTLLATGSDAERQSRVQAWRTVFNSALTDPDERKSYAYQLSRLVAACRFLTCFFTLPDIIIVFAAFAEAVGPQLIKQGTVSDLMKLVRQTQVVKAAVNDLGMVTPQVKDSRAHYGGGKSASSAGGPPKVTVADMIEEIRTRFAISDEEALYIKQVTEQKAQDPDLCSTVQSHREDRVFLEGTFRQQVNGEIRTIYADLARYDELADEKYTDQGGIFDLMAMTAIQTQLWAA